MKKAGGNCVCRQPEFPSLISSAIKVFSKNQQAHLSGRFWLTNISTML